ncbi:MAG: hypothetical protein K2J99_15460 [Lachnospiraceae bacterium]|nr:hypothetical protein [Lachnospiraceae bacterium]
MSVVEEIREQQKQALSTMSLKGKLSYFWDYYKIHTLVAVCVLIVAISVIHQLVTNKDYALYATVINTGTTSYEDETAGRWAEQFGDYAQIDTDEYQVLIDATIVLTESSDPQIRMANQQKMVAMMQTGAIHAQLAETETFEEYAQFECYYALEDILSAEELEKYRPYFYYTDAATFEQNDTSDTASGQNEDTASADMAVQTDPSTLVINHRDPSTMEQPVAVGIILTDSKMIKDSDYYKYLDSPESDYQGYPSDVIFGIPLSNKEPEMALKFLEFLNVTED